MNKLPETIIVNGKEIKYDIDAFVKQYEDRKTLPSNKIVCTESGKLITMFGTNLHKRVAKYNNSIRELLTTFVCKEVLSERAKLMKAQEAENKTNMSEEDKEAAKQKRDAARISREEKDEIDGVEATIGLPEVEVTEAEIADLIG